MLFASSLSRWRTIASSSSAAAMTTPTTPTSTTLCADGAHGRRALSTSRGHPLGWHNMPGELHATTVVSVRKNKQVVVVADGQVSLGATIVKPNARKVRRLGSDATTIAGFAGATADALTLFERLESRLEEHNGQLLRSCVEVAKQWRTDKYLRQLEAIMVVSDRHHSLTLTGNGDVLEPRDGIIGIGSGGPFALAAARALIDDPTLSAEQVALRAMRIAADMCVYTNDQFIVETLDYTDDADTAHTTSSPSSSSSSSSSRKKKKTKEDASK